jgi:hypothetical protein
VTDYNAAIGVMQLIITVVLIIVSIMTLVYFTKKDSKTLKQLRIYIWVYAGNSIINNFSNRFFYLFFEENIITNYLDIGLAIASTVLIALALNEYINTSTRVKNTFYNNGGIQNNVGKKRITLLFFGTVDSPNVVNWYNEVKSELNKDNIEINKIMASPDKLLDSYSKYYDLETREKEYLERINIEICELGFSCGNNNTCAPCYGDMSWGKQIYKEGMSLSFSYTTVQTIAIERYIDIIKNI